MEQPHQPDDHHPKTDLVPQPVDHRVPPTRVGEVLAGRPECGPRRHSDNAESRRPPPLPVDDGGDAVIGHQDEADHEQEEEAHRGLTPDVVPGNRRLPGQKEHGGQGDDHALDTAGAATTQTGATPGRAAPPAPLYPADGSA